VSGSISNSLYEDIGYSYNSQIYLGTPQVFTFTVNADRGNPLSYFYAIFETWPSGVYSCKVGFDHSADVPYAYGLNTAFLFDDQGNQMGPIGLNDPSQFQHNKKCGLFGSGTNAILNGTTWTITLNVVFYQPYGAPVTVLINGVSNQTTGTNWLTFPELTFPNVSSSAPSTVAIVSNNGMSLENDIQIFSVRLRGQAGGISIFHTELVFFQGNSWLIGYDGHKNASSRCRVGAEVTANVMWVETLNGWNYVPIGSTATPAQAGSNCTLYPQYSSVSQTNEDTIEVRFAVSFPSTFSGVLQDHVYVKDTLSQDHWDTSPDPQWNWFVWPSASGPAPTLPSSFTGCIITANSSCPLYAYKDSSGYVVPYSISQTYEIAPGVYINAPDGASIQRSPNGGVSGFPGVSPMLHVASGSLITNIQGLNVLGNRWAIGHVSNAVPNPDDTLHRFETVSLGQFTTQVALAPHDNLSTSYSIQQDVTVDTDAVYLSKNNFYDAPGFGLVLESIGPHTPNQNPYVVVSGGSANNSNQAAIKIYGNANLAAPCLSKASYVGPNGYASGVPANIGIAGVNISNSSGGPIVVDSGYNIQLTGNIIQDHQLEPPAFDFESEGGAFVTNECAANVTIDHNNVDGTNVGTPGAQGMEIHSLNTNISNNTLTNIAGDGIYLEETCGASVYNNSITNANARQQGDGGANQTRTGGIYLANQAAYNRQVQDVQVWGSSVSNSAAGLYFFNADNSLGFSNVFFQYSCLSSPVQPLFGGTVPSGVASPSSYCGTVPTTPSPMSCSVFQ
jgi:hypothetical protein